MNIQSNINQTLSIAGLLISQNPSLRQRAESKAHGKSIQYKQVGAIRGLEDIEKNLKRATLTDELKEGKDPAKEKELKDLGGEKSYIPEELENMSARTSEYQKAIYDAKVAALNPEFQKYVNPNEISQPELSGKLENIRKMKERAMESYQAANESKAASQTTIDHFKRFIETGGQYE